MHVSDQQVDGQRAAFILIDGFECDYGAFRPLD